MCIKWIRTSSKANNTSDSETRILHCGFGIVSSLDCKLNRSDVIDADAKPIKTIIMWPIWKQKKKHSKTVNESKHDYSVLKGGNFSGQKLISMFTVNIYLSILIPIIRN